LETSGPDGRDDAVERAGFWQRSPLLSQALAALAALVACAFVAQLDPIPNPRSPRDFSTLLLADTFRQGRLANPTPDYARFAESPEVLIEPHYVSTQPALQAVFPFLGLVLGDPYRGTALGFALGCAALVWALRAWTRAGIALAAALSAALSAHLADRIGISLGPSSAIFFGSALVLGALPRVAAASGGASVGTALGAGVLVLAVFDPLVAAWALVFGSAALRSAMGTDVGRRQLVIAFAVAAALGGTLALYNAATTGSLLRSPASRYAEQHPQVPELWFQDFEGVGAYAPPNTSFERAYAAGNRAERVYQLRHSWDGFLRGIDKKYREQLVPLFGVSGAVLSAVALVARRERKVWIPLAGISGIAALSALRTRDDFAHVASAIPLVALLVGAALERLARLRWRGRAVGLVLAAYAIPVWIADHTNAVQNERLWSDSSPLDWRSKALAEIEDSSDRAVVLVAYRSPAATDHEWVYNGADPDSQRVIWLREGSAEENAALAERFADRDLWLAATKSGPLSLQRHPLRTRWWFEREARKNPALLALTPAERRALERWYRGEQERQGESAAREQLRKTVRLLVRRGELPEIERLAGEERDLAIEANVSLRIENRRRRAVDQIRESRVSHEFEQRWQALEADPARDPELAGLAEPERRRILLDRVRQSLAEQALDEAEKSAALLERALAVYRASR
jgi:hypothetical protein